MKSWPQVFHGQTVALMAELERLDPKSVVLARARRALDVASSQEVKAKSVAEEKRLSLMERLMERDAKDATAASLYQQGYTMLQIGRLLGHSPDWVSGALTRTQTPRRGVGRPHATPAVASERVIKIRAMREAGETLAEIGRELCLTRERVRQLCNQHDIQKGSQ